MVWRRLGAGAILLAVVVLGALIGYEAFALMRAKLRTPAALAAVAAREVRLKDIPPARIAAFLAVDDPGFWRHHGVDFQTPGQGMTTLTQSLVKRMYFKPFRPGFAKLEQGLIARFVLDPAMGKADQLEVAIDYSYMGHVDGREIIGFPAAARAYYGKELRALTDQEFLGLVALRNAPDALDPRRHPAANAERVARIERLLAGACKPRGLLDVDYPDCARPR
jgi:membrane carboxypeptidase/penicillin-binding protein